MHQAVSTPVPSPLTAKQRRTRRKKQIIYGSIALLTLWIVASIIWNKREKPIPVTTETAIRKTIVQTVSATGKIQPEVEVKISPEVAGEIIELPVEDGMRVKKGDLLVKIKPDSYKALLEQQEAAISAAKATNLQQKATMLKSEHDFKRAEDLFNKKLISEQEYNAAQAADDVAKNTYESSLHEIERAQAGSSQARDQLSKTTIYSPIDGTITILNSKLGERLVATGQFAGTEVMRVADLGHMEARVDVNENDVVNVKLGDKAEVKIDAYGDRKFNGTVYQIGNTGKTTGAGTQEEVTNFEVKIRIEDHDVELKPALSCTADIHTNEVKDVVAVPMQAVTIRTGESNLSPEEIEKKRQKVTQRDKGDNNAEFVNERAEKAAQKEEREKLVKVVFLKKGNKAQIAKVTTGISDDTYTEIKSGIQAGDEVISGSYSAISRKLKEGAKVALDKEGMK
ncbi:MAG: efflux RND transporter periplasmic adaptor subunit [Verrucomicrobia bacterium]|jgi:HlyD family secretion protein|nr:MAG: efflux transporter periplasmic adaptor subunit [Verrucomicrobia bacterium 13_2_20CM_54_12]OLB44620.1 MAG: efflux transporter periplasmic adaptor subunit [Verrucomicrobia bacterium 13_2_20CM_2_54_15]OLD74478.1 MAG: efflux transporter periplasmic adaptor subunit [Verrucomicrobia bacterium 13_1_20CM_54_28]OLD89465.1 MAG: efflux transporter periplasmic adaptor subunit [Verrucomicrobia bacterium 13_1_20CM_4_54_11]OLE11441.1 MAG: efflux transporter periplasmic adaptor subunit [Verrucomicrobia